MVKVDLKGIAKVTAKGRTYWYAWRGGPRLRGEPGSAEFIASYNEAHERRRQPDPGRFYGLVAAYRASAGYQRLAPATKVNFSRFLDRIAEHFGSLSVAQFDRPERIRPVILQWRSRWQSTPRTADYALQVLSVVLSYGVDLGRVAGNPCEGIRRLYKNDRSEIIWTDADLAMLKPACSPEMSRAVDLAVHTGLRLGDLTRLCWSHIGDDAIVIPTSKSRGRREAMVPLYGALREVLASIPKKSTTVLTNSKGQPWKDLATMFVRAKAGAGMGDRDLNFHDLRGTAATRFYAAGIPLADIAEIMGWEPSRVERIIRRYVGRSAVARRIIQRLDKTGK
jgi:integrase